MIYHLLAIVSLLSPAPVGVRVRRGLSYGDSPRHRLDIYSPAKMSGRLPVICFFYGGSWSMGERGYFAFVARCLAAAGYLVVVPDYRLVPRVEYPGFVVDCARALRWVADHIGAHGGDVERMAAIGHSAGAYNMMMAVLGQGDGPKLRALAGLSGPYDFYPFDGPISLRVFGAVRAPRATQPVNNVRSGLPPVFLAHGDADDLVSPRNSVALAAAWRANGNNVTEKHYPGVSHAGTLLQLGAWGRPGPVHADLLAFLKTTLH